MIDSQSCLGPKKRGLRLRDPPQDVNQSLVDDGLVDMDKIGSSNFFWSFPSKVAVTKQNRVNALKENLAKVSSLGGYQNVS